MLSCVPIKMLTQKKSLDLSVYSEIVMQYITFLAYFICLKHIFICRYTLETHVREIIGDSFYFYDGYMSVHATLSDLLSHRTGIPEYYMASFLGVMEQADIVE